MLLVVLGGIIKDFLSSLTFTTYHYKAVLLLVVGLYIFVAELHSSLSQWKT